MQQPQATQAGRTRTGVIYALGAFFTWGLILPLHYKALITIPAVTLLAQRVLWSALCSLVILLGVGKGPVLLKALRTPRLMAWLTASAAFLGVNWLLFIWAVNNGFLKQTSLGYITCPLLNMILAVIFLRERLLPIQAAACLLAAAGVLVLAVAGGTMPWLAMLLAITFAPYGLLRKFAPVDPLVGFFIECLLLTPPTIFYLLLFVPGGLAAGFEGQAWSDILLAGTGLTTTAALVFYAASAQRLLYSTLALLQFISPSFQLGLGVLVYGEPFRLVDAVSYAMIWAALGLYIFSALRRPA